MKKLALPLAAIALALSLGSMILPATAQQVSSTAVWEYRVFRLDPNEFKHKADYLAILNREGARKADGAFRQHVLNHVGQEGWELVQVEQRARDLVYLYLKRPKR